MTPALWFYDHGIGVFPIAAGTKEPACGSWDDYQCSRLQAAHFRNYGVRLGVCRHGRLAVADSDKPEAEAWVAANLPDTPFKVRTARGLHRYYRTFGPVPHFINRDGLKIEFRNQGQYVLGPGSVHPGNKEKGIPPGSIYTASDWSWQWDELPYFPSEFCWDDRPLDERESGDGQPLKLPEVVSDQRHVTLHRIMRSLVARGVPLDGAVKVCLLENKAKCRPPLDEDDDLSRFLKRAYHQKDRANFVRTPSTAWELAGGLFEIGLSFDAVMVACRSVDPAFNPLEGA